MRREENDCCGCAVPAYPCIGDICPMRHVLHLYCDECNGETDTLYDYEAQELCEDCLKRKAKLISIE